MLGSGSGRGRAELEIESMSSRNLGANTSTKMHTVILPCLLKLHKPSCVCIETTGDLKGKTDETSKKAEKASFYPKAQKWGEHGTEQKDGNKKVRRKRGKTFVKCSMFWLG